METVTKKSQYIGIERGETSSVQAEVAVAQ